MRQHWRPAKRARARGGAVRDRDPLCSGRAAAHIAGMSKLVIGTRRYSSWSLRGWLMVRLAGLAVAEEVIPLAGGVTAALRGATPTGLVPYLEHDGEHDGAHAGGQGRARIWESLAIAEYCAERAPALWPSDRVARAHARSIAAEMHAGFRALRMEMPFNCGRTFAARAHTPECLADVRRIEAIWAEARERFGHGGPYLFGAAFNAADAMYAPVVSRFITHQPALTRASRAYCEAVREHPLVEAWYAAAAEEPQEWHLEKYENWA